MHRDKDCLIKRYKTKLPKPEENWPVNVQKVTQYIHTYLFDPDLTITSMYEKCNITDKNFAGKFSVYTGLTPKKYIQHHRIECAKEILKQAHHNHNTIIKTAFKSGYSNQSTFTKAFKSQVGMTPGRWIAENNQGKMQGIFQAFVLFVSFY